MLPVIVRGKSYSTSEWLYCYTVTAFAYEGIYPHLQANSQHSLDVMIEWIMMMLMITMIMIMIRIKPLVFEAVKGNVAQVSTYLHINLARRLLPVKVRGRKHHIPPRFALLASSESQNLSNTRSSSSRRVTLLIPMKRRALSFFTWLDSIAGEEKIFSNRAAWPAPLL